MELFRIPTKDIRPDANNPRKDFGDIAALAESFRLNPADPGEPLQPIVTVRDGNVFRIVDGERRFRAMKELGTIECWSNVCDDFAEADAVVQMLATNDKMELDEHEKSLGVQTMLLLGVDEQTVEKAAHIEGAGRVRRAMEKTPHASQLTIGHLIAIAEADEAGDEEASEELKRAGEARWETVAAKHRRKRKAREDYERIVSDARDVGYAILEDEPAVGELGEREYVFDSGRDRLEELHGEGFRHLFAEANYWGCRCEVFMDHGCTRPAKGESGGWGLGQVAEGGKLDKYSIPHLKVWLDFYDMLMNAGWTAPDFFAELACDVEDAIADSGADGGAEAEDGDDV